MLNHQVIQHPHTLSPTVSQYCTHFYGAVHQMPYFGGSLLYEPCFKVSVTLVIGFHMEHHIAACRVLMDASQPQYVNPAFSLADAITLYYVMDNNVADFTTEEKFFHCNSVPAASEQLILQF